MMKVKNDLKVTLSKLFFRITLLPFSIILLLIFTFNSYVSITEHHENLILEAKEIATLLSVTAASEENSTEIMAKQIDLLLDMNDRIVNVTFYPITNSIPKNVASNSPFFDDLVSAIEPVSMSLSQRDEQKLIGYIYVTMDFQHQRLAVLKLLLFRLFITFVVLVVVYFIHKRIFFYYYKPINQVVYASGKLLNNEYNFKFDEAIKTRSSDIGQIEEALIYAATKLKNKAKQIHELQKINAFMNKKEKEVFDHQLSFQSMMSHELRTPLNAIAGGLQLLETQKLEASAADSVHIIQQGYNKLNDMLINIIKLNDISQGDVVIESAVFSPEELLREVAEDFSNKCLQKGLSLNVNIKHTHIRLFGDIKKVQSVLIYLMDNAIKFTESGSVTLESDVTFNDNNKVMWRCSVIDTGIGIEKGFHKDIFNAYVQVQSGNMREYEGSGLGLTLASRLTELLGGQLIVESEVGQGSTFCMKLLLDDSSKSKKNLSLKGMKILHLHSGFSEDFIYGLGETEAQAVSYRNLNLALNAVQSTNFDLVTICTKVDEETVIKFVQKIRASEAEHRVYVACFVENTDIDTSNLQLAGVDYFYEYKDLYNFVRQVNLWMRD